MTRARDKANLTQKITTSEPTQLTDGMIWLDTDAVAVSQQSMRWTKTPSGGTTVLSGASDTSVTLSYSAGQEQVYANGVLLIRGSDYTASNGTSITLASASVAGDVFEVISIIPLTLVDTYTQAQADAKYVNNTLADAKGDLVVGTADNVISKIPVGSNGQSLIADSTTTSGLRWQDSTQAGKNFLINGGIDIWQRGTSFTTTGAGNVFYSADRWTCYSGNTGTISRDTSLVPVGFESSLKFTSTINNSGIDFYQLIETKNVIPLRGKVVTLSAYVAGTNGKTTPGMTAYYSETTDDMIYLTSGVAIQTMSVPTGLSATTFQRLSMTFTVPATAKTLRIGFISGTLNNTEFINWSGMQLEVGSVATHFSRAGGNFGGELTLCQRYYQRYKADSVFDDLGYSGKATSSTVIYASRIPFVPFRTAPATVDFANVTYIPSWGAGTTSVSTVAISSYSCADTPLLTFTTTGLTTGTTYIILAGNTSDAYIGLSAEL